MQLTCGGRRISKHLFEINLSRYLVMNTAALTLMFVSFYWYDVWILLGFFNRIDVKMKVGSDQCKITIFWYFLQIHHLLAPSRPKNVRNWVKLSKRFELTTCDFTFQIRYLKNSPHPSFARKFPINNLKNVSTISSIFPHSQFTI